MMSPVGPDKWLTVWTFCAGPVVLSGFEPLWSPVLIYPGLSDLGEGLD
jgi:hypothetical protein